MRLMRYWNASSSSISELQYSYHGMYTRQDGLTNNLHLNILDHASIDPLHHIFWNIITSNIKSHSNSNRNKQKIFRVAKKHIYQTWIGQWSAPNSIRSTDHTTKIHGKLGQAPPKERTNEKGERVTREKKGTKASQRGRERGSLKRDTRSKGKERGREGSWRYKMSGGEGLWIEGETMLSLREREWMIGKKEGGWRVSNWRYFFFILKIIKKSKSRFVVSPIQYGQ